MQIQDTQGRLSQLAVNDEGFAFDPQTGESFTLNDMGRRLVQALAAGDALDEIVDVLAERFSMETREVRADVWDFIEQLRINNLMGAES